MSIQDEQIKLQHSRSIMGHKLKELHRQENISIESLTNYLHLNRNDIEYCPFCYSNIKDRTVSLYKGLINALYHVYQWCGEKERHEFETKNITHLLGKNEYARFGDLVRFGGIVYKPKDNDDNTRKALFGINMKRAKAFFAGEYKIPIQIVINQITNQIEAATYVAVWDFPGLVEYLNEYGLYDYEKQMRVQPDYALQKTKGIPTIEEYKQQGTLI